MARPVREGPHLAPQKLEEGGGQLVVEHVAVLVAAIIADPHGAAQVVEGGRQGGAAEAAVDAFPPPHGLTAIIALAPVVGLGGKAVAGQDFGHQASGLVFPRRRVPAFRIGHGGILRVGQAPAAGTGLVRLAALARGSSSADGDCRRGAREPVKKSRQRPFGFLPDEIEAWDSMVFLLVRDA
jgi:hypothetical protein